MSAVEEIEAAIARLTELRGKSNSGPWEPIRQEEPESGAALFVLGNGPSLDSDFNNIRDYADADLIVTLHRTIDAQLAILMAGRTAYGPSFKDVNYRDLPGWAAEARSHALTFAEAINGTAA